MVKFIKNTKIKLCGRTIVKHKAVFAMLACFTAISFLSVNILAASIDSHISLASMSNKNDTGFIDKAKLAAKIAGGVASAALLIFGGKKLFDYFEDRSYNYNAVINKYLKTNLNVSFDDWFKRLGGTEDDINSYLEKLNSDFVGTPDSVPNAQPDKAPPQTLSEEYKQIDIDIPRTLSRIKITGNGISENDETGLLNRILKFREAETMRGYWQGMPDVAALVINKFWISNERLWNDKDEAKIYYIYKTIVEATPGSFCIEKDDMQDYLGRITDCALQSKYLRRYSLPDIENMKPLALFGSYMTGGTRMCSTGCAINLWDNILSDDSIVKNGKFDESKALDKIALVSSAVLAKICTENREKIPDNMESIKYIQDMMSGGWESNESTR